MVTVRFPSGFSVQYNSLSQIRWDETGSGGAMLFGTKPDGTRNAGWSVHVPKECIVEFIQPCRAYDANGPTPEIQFEVRELRKQIESLKRAINKKK
jgi:hypothetical protein